MRSALEFAGSAPEEGESGVVMSSEESSTYPDHSDLDLGLGLSLACGDGGKRKLLPPPPAGGGSWDQYGRILIAEDFHSVVSAKVPSSSASSSSSSVNKVHNNSACGTKRTAEPPSSPPGRSSVGQVVGWPPVRTYRLNSLVNHAKSPVARDFFSTVDESKSKSAFLENDTNHSGNTNDITKEKGPRKTSLFVKVNLDGIPIGRKVDLSAHRSYETLAQALDDMFKLSTAIGARRSCNMEGQVDFSGQRKPLKLLDGSSDFVLTYEDRDGDWMLVGDVPWELFVISVRRLRIMRTAEATGLGSHGRSRKH